MSSSNGNTNESSSSLPLSPRELELQRKRARDRKSQQAMRDRNKWTIQTLSEQVASLSSTLEAQAHALHLVEAKLGYVENENAQLRAQNAALQLSLLGRGGEEDHVQSPGVASTSSSLSTPLWELRPKNTPPSCLSDQILQGFVDTVRDESFFGLASPGEKAARFPLRPNFCSLLDKGNRSDDDISNVVADVLRTYTEIDGMPRRVAVFYLMATLLKVLRRQHPPFPGAFIIMTKRRSGWSSWTSRAGICYPTGSDQSRASL